jgi:hypothetical protein
MYTIYILPGRHATWINPSALFAFQEQTLEFQGTPLVGLRIYANFDLWMH